MEATLKPRMDGRSPLEVRRNHSSEVTVANASTVRSSDALLRLVAIVLTLVAIIVAAISKQTKTVSMTVLPNLPPLDVEVTAKWQYSSAFAFFLVTNIIAFVYAVVSLVLMLGNRGRSNGIGLAVIILDLVMVGLLSSGNGAAAAIGALGYKGNSHVQWKKVCNMVGMFCGRIAGSIAISLVGTLTFLLLVTMATFNLYRIRSH